MLVYKKHNSMWYPIYNDTSEYGDDDMSTEHVDKKRKLN